MDDANGFKCIGHGCSLASASCNSLQANKIAINSSIVIPAPAGIQYYQADSEFRPRRHSSH
jgi:hypothetical protein